MSKRKGELKEAPKPRYKNRRSSEDKSHSSPHLSAPQALSEEDKNGTAWAILESLIGTYDGPADWSEEHDHYLYGWPKKRA